jgi:transposase
MWAKENRRRYDRSRLRYETDLSDEEWAKIAPLIPPAKPGGNKRSVNLREVVNGLMYILGTGCQWRAIPKDLAPRSAVSDYFDRCSGDGTLQRIHDMLYLKCRDEASRKASPTAAIIDAQSVRSAEKGGASIDPHGYDAGKKVKGKKRHVLVDTQGLMLHAIVTAADIQDRDGGAWLLGNLFGLYSFLLMLYADGGYEGPGFRASVKANLAQVDVDIVKRSDRAKGFVVLPKRWAVERTLAWLNRCRRLSKVWENLNHKARAFLLMASIRLIGQEIMSGITMLDGTATPSVRGVRSDGCILLIPAGARLLAGPSTKGDHRVATTCADDRGHDLGRIGCREAILYFPNPSPQIYAFLEND